MTMIGAAVWRLRAESEGWLPEIRGRALHAAFLAALGEFSPALATRVHDTSRPNPFSLSPLARSDGTQVDGRHVCRGNVMDLRLSSLSEEMSDFVRYRAPDSLRVGRVPFAVERVLTEREEHPETGFTEAEALFEECLAGPLARTVVFRFLSPVMFHVGRSNYPWPLPGLVFASLADRWATAGLPGGFVKQTTRQEAEAIQPLAWQGGTVMVTVKPQQEKLAFTGMFTYDLRPLPEEARRRFLLLTRFAALAGVGRMTSQGFGQTRTEWH